MRRETFLVTGEWHEGEWPSMKQVVSNPTLADGTKLVRAVGVSALSAEPTVDYLYIRNAKLDHHKFSDDNKTITITASKTDMSEYEKPISFVGKRQRLLNGIASVTMHKASAPGEPDLKAGLAYYKDEHRHMKLFYDFSFGDIVFEITNMAKSILRVSRNRVELKDFVAFRVQYTERSFQFSYRNGAESGSWTAFDALDSLDTVTLH